MSSEPIISADSHVFEPVDLWVERLEKPMRDRAPHCVPRAGRMGLSLVAPGLDPFPVAALSAVGKSGEELKAHMGMGYDAVRRGGWDPVERIKDQETDGVRAEVLYTSLGMPLFQLQDAALQQACFAVYNDWLAEFCSYDSRRLVGIGLISLADISRAVAELERCRKIGLRGAMIWGCAPGDRPYSRKLYDPFWQAASELEMPLSLHVVTQGDRANPTAKFVDYLRSAEDEVPGIAVVATPTFLPIDIQASLYTMAVGGVLLRFPNLKLVSAENDVGWLPNFLHRTDHFYEKFGKVAGIKGLAMTPALYLRRQMWATFQEDAIGPLTYEHFGEDRYMWASDFPHSDTTWPHSHEIIGRDFAKVPHEVTRKIVHDNAARLYAIEPI